MTTLGLNHLTLAVSDLQRSVRFYVDVVGCTRVATWDSGAYLRAGSHWICLSKDPAAAGARRGDYSHMAFSYDAQGIESLRARLREAAAVTWKENNSEGDSVYFLDPDGHQLEGHVGSLQTRLESVRAAPYSGWQLHEGDAADAVEIRDATPADREVILALNLADVAHTSPMDAARLAHLDGLSCHHRVACLGGRVSAFLLAIRSGAPYANENFAWFTRKHADFVYVDRVVVASDARGKRLASLLYEDLFAWARRNGVPLVACEYNIDPANEPSRRLHDKLGFKEKGTQWLANRTKRVSMQVAKA